MENQINLSEITDAAKIKAFMADEFIARDNAQAQIQNANANLQAMNARLNEIAAEEAQVVETDKKATKK